MPCSGSGSGGTGSTVDLRPCICPHVAAPRCGCRQAPSAYLPHRPHREDPARWQPRPAHHRGRRHLRTPPRPLPSGGHRAEEHSTRGLLAGGLRTGHLVGRRRGSGRRVVLGIGSVESFDRCPHPVHRQMCATSAFSKLVALGEVPTSGASRIAIPGVQNPHCEAPQERNASAKRFLVAAGTPSIVVTERPSTREVAVTHETRGSPSTNTVQHPHWPCGAQPSFTEVIPNCSRSVSSRERCACTESTRTGTPFKVKELSTLTGAELCGVLIVGAA